MIEIDKHGITPEDCIKWLKSKFDRGPMYHHPDDTYAIAIEEYLELLANANISGTNYTMQELRVHRYIADLRTGKEWTWGKIKDFMYHETDHLLIEQLQKQGVIQHDFSWDEYDGDRYPTAHSSIIVAAKKEDWP